MKITDQLIRYRLNDGLVIARSGGNRVFVMNASARFIWELLENGIDPAEIPSRMSEHYGIDAGQVESDLHRTLEQWRRDGLTSEPRSRQHHYSLGGVAFNITCSDGAIDAVISPVFSHLEVPESQHSNEAKEFSVEADGCEFIL